MLSSGRGVPEGSLGEKCGVEKLVERAMLPVKKELETIKHRLGSKGGVPSRNVDDTNAMKLSIKKIDKSLKKLQDQVRKSQNLFQKDRKELFGKVDAIRNEVTAIRMQWKAVNDKFSAFDFDNQKFWFASLERMTKENLDNLMDDEHMTRITTAMKDCISDDSENFLEDLYDTDPYHLCSALKKIKRARKKAVK
ncbi:unnamed protein product [Albugo candida]|nr:unnamed protein product [Albugo candida]|eukprot:CCI47794.1 unnamed protein product [Albugo candida]